MLVKSYTKDNIVTPECCYIKDWNINLSCKDKNTISIEDIVFRLDEMCCERNYFPVVAARITEAGITLYCIQ